MPAPQTDRRPDALEWAKTHGWKHEMTTGFDGEVIRDVFTPDQKRDLIERVTDAVVSVEGEALRDVTWVRVQEIREGDWGIGGRTLSAADVREMANRPVG